MNQYDIVKDMRYLELLSHTFPTVAEASTEIINLQAILNLPKGGGAGGKLVDDTLMRRVEQRRNERARTGAGDVEVEKRIRQHQKKSKRTVRKRNPRQHQTRFVHLDLLSGTKTGTDKEKGRRP